MTTLASWGALVRDERPAPTTLRREVRALAAFLRAHLDWLAAHPAARELSQALDDVVGAAQHVIHPEANRRLEMGTCESRGCTSTVYATFRADNGHAPTVVSCDVGHVMGPHEWLRLHHHAQQARQAAGGSPSSSSEQAA